MQTVIFILTILCLLRGASVIKKALTLGSVELQVKKAERNLAKLKETEGGVFVSVFFIMLFYGIALFGLSIYALLQFV